MLGIFAVGTINLADTVVAAKWKKFDSGSYTGNVPEPGYKNKFLYKSYVGFERY